MALQPSGTAPVQPGPTLAVQTFLYPNKTIKPSSMKGVSVTVLGVNNHTHHRSSCPAGEVGGRKTKAAERIRSLDLGSQEQLRYQQPSDPSFWSVANPSHWSSAPAAVQRWSQGTNFPWPLQSQKPWKVSPLSHPSDVS